MNALCLKTVNLFVGQFGKAQAQVSRGEKAGYVVDCFGAIRFAVIHERSPLEATHDDVRYAVERRLVGLSTRIFSASVNYIRGGFGKCLTWRANSHGPRSIRYNR